MAVDPWSDETQPQADSAQTPNLGAAATPFPDAPPIETPNLGASVTPVSSGPANPWVETAQPEAVSAPVDEGPANPWAETSVPTTNFGADASAEPIQQEDAGNQNEPSLPDRIGGLIRDPLGTVGRSIQGYGQDVGAAFDRSGRDFGQAGQDVQQGRYLDAAGGVLSGIGDAAGTVLKPAVDVALAPFTAMGRIPQAIETGNTLADQLGVPAPPDQFRNVAPIPGLPFTIAQGRAIQGYTGLPATALFQGPEAAANRLSQAWQQNEHKGLGDVLRAEDTPWSIPKEVPIVGGISGIAPGKSALNALGELAPFFVPIAGEAGLIVKGSKALEGVKGLGTVGKAVEMYGTGLGHALEAPSKIIAKVSGGPQVGAVITTGAFLGPMAASLVGEISKTDENGDKQVFYRPADFLQSDPSGFVLPVVLGLAAASVWRAGGGGAIALNKLSGSGGGLGVRTLDIKRDAKPTFVRDIGTTVDVRGVQQNVPVEVVGVKLNRDGVVVDSFGRILEDVRPAQPGELIARYTNLATSRPYANAAGSLDGVEALLMSDLRNSSGGKPDIAAKQLYEVLSDPAKAMDILGGASDRPDIQAAIKLLERTYNAKGPDLAKAISRNIDAKNGNFEQFVANAMKDSAAQVVREIGIKNPDWLIPEKRLEALREQLKADPETKKALVQAIRDEGGNGSWLDKVKPKDAKEAVKTIERAWASIEGTEGLRLPDALNQHLIGYNTNPILDLMSGSKQVISPYLLVGAPRYFVNNFIGNTVITGLGTMGRVFGFVTEKAQDTSTRNRGLEGGLKSEYMGSGTISNQIRGSESDFLPRQAGVFRQAGSRFGQTGVGKTLNTASGRGLMQAIGEKMKDVHALNENWARRSSFAAISTDIFDKSLFDLVNNQRLLAGDSPAVAKAYADTVVHTVAQKGLKALRGDLSIAPDFKGVPKDMRDAVRKIWDDAKGNRTKFVDDIQRLADEHVAAVKQLIENDPREFARKLAEDVKKVTESPPEETPAPAVPETAPIPGFTPDYRNPFPEKFDRADLALPYENKPIPLTLPKDFIEAIGKSASDITPRTLEETKKVITRVLGTEEARAANNYARIAEKVKDLFKEPKSERPLRDGTKFTESPDYDELVKAILQERGNVSRVLRSGKADEAYRRVARALTENEAKTNRPVTKKLNLREVIADPSFTGMDLGVVYHVLDTYSVLLRDFKAIPVPKVGKELRQVVMVPNAAAVQLEAILNSRLSPAIKQTKYKDALRKFETKYRNPAEVTVQEPIHEVTIKGADQLTYKLALTDDLKAQFDAAKTLTEKRAIVGLDQKAPGEGRYHEELGQVGFVQPPGPKVAYGSGEPAQFFPEGTRGTVQQDIRYSDVKIPWPAGVKPLEVDWRSQWFGPDTPSITLSPNAEWNRKQPKTGEETARAAAEGTKGAIDATAPEPTPVEPTVAPVPETAPVPQAPTPYSRNATIRPDEIPAALAKLESLRNAPPTDTNAPNSIKILEGIIRRSGGKVPDPRPALDRVGALIHSANLDMAAAFENVTSAVLKLTPELRNAPDLAVQVGNAIKDRNVNGPVRDLADALVALDGKQRAFEAARSKAFEATGLKPEGNIPEADMRKVLDDIPDINNPGWKVDGVEYTGKARLEGTRWVTEDGRPLTFDNSMAHYADPVPNMGARISDHMTGIVNGAKNAVAATPELPPVKTTLADLEKMVKTAQQIAVREGMNQTKALLIDYDQRTTGQWLADHWSPFSMWTIQHMLTVSRWIAPNPQVYAAMAIAIRGWAEANKDRSPFDKFKIFAFTMPNGDDVMINPASFFPFATQGIVSMVNPDEDSLMKNVLDIFGLSPHFPINLAMQWWQTKAPKNPVTSWYTGTKPGDKRTSSLLPQDEIIRLLSGGKIDLEGGRLFDVYFPSLRQGIYGASVPASNYTAMAMELETRVFRGEITELDAKRAILSAKLGKLNDLAQGALEAGLANKGIGNLLRYLGAPVGFEDAAGKAINTTFRDVAKVRAQDIEAQKRLNPNVGASVRPAEFATSAEAKAKMSELFRANPAAGIASVASTKTTPEKLGQSIRIDEQPAYIGGTPEQQARWAAANKAYGDAYGAAINSGKTPAQAGEAARAALQQAGFDYYKDYQLGNYYENPERKKALAEMGGYPFTAARDRYKDAPKPEVAIIRDQAIEAYFRLRDTGLSARDAESRVSQQFGAQVWAGAKANSLKTDGTLTFGATSGTTTSRTGTGGAGGTSAASSADRTKAFDEYRAIQAKDKSAGALYFAEQYDRLYPPGSKNAPPRPDIAKVKADNEKFAAIAERTKLLNQRPPANDARARAIWYEQNAAALDKLNERIGDPFRYTKNTQPFSPATARTVTPPVRSGGGGGGGGGSGFNPGQEPYPPPKGKRWSWKKLPNGKVEWFLINENAAA